MDNEDKAWLITVSVDRKSRGSYFENHLTLEDPLEWLMRNNEKYGHIYTFMSAKEITQEQFEKWDGHL